jgi:transposase
LTGVYHTRSIAETIIGRVKQRTGEILFSIREDLQDLELRLKGIVNNLLAANLMRASTIIGELPLISV